MPFTSPRWKPFFEDLERRGILPQLVKWLDERQAADEDKLRVLLRTTVIDDAKKLAEVHALQGRLSARAADRAMLRTLGERPKTQTLKDAAESA